MKTSTRLTIQTKDGWLLIAPNEISYIKSDDIYSYLYNGIVKYFVSSSLKSLEAILPSDQFIRCHRSYIINVNKVRRIIKNHNCSLVMENGDEVPVSRGKKATILKHLI